MKKNLFPPTTKRVAMNTCDEINAEIRDQTIHCINTFKDSSQEILNDRIEKLNCEWDTERLLETNAGSMILLSAMMGFNKRKSCWYLLTGTVGFFLLQHALLGSCPPLSFIRKMGIRTAEEINNEKTVLKMIRGDFTAETDDIDEMLKMAEK